MHEWGWLVANTHTSDLPSLASAREEIEQATRARIVGRLRERYPEPTQVPEGYVNPHDIIALIERGEV